MTSPEGENFAFPGCFFRCDEIDSNPVKMTRSLLKCLKNGFEGKILNHASKIKGSEE